MVKELAIAGVAVLAYRALTRASVPPPTATAPEPVDAKQLGPMAVDGIPVAQESVGGATLAVAKDPNPARPNEATKLSIMTAPPPPSTVPILCGADMATEKTPAVSKPLDKVNAALPGQPALVRPKPVAARKNIPTATLSNAIRQRQDVSNGGTGDLLT